MNAEISAFIFPLILKLCSLYLGTLEEKGELDVEEVGLLLKPVTAELSRCSFHPRPGGLKCDKESKEYFSSLFLKTHAREAAVYAEIRRSDELDEYYEGK